jgi:hydrogenase-4 component B
MNTFLLSLVILVAGGVIPLLTYRQTMLTKWLYLGTTLLGCCTGLFSLFSPAAGLNGAAWSYSWLHSFTLAFSCDSLSVFFLVPIFLICPLAAVYSFAYFDKAEHSLRIAVSFCCTNILIAAMALVCLAANILTFALVWEIMSLSSYVLVMYSYEKAQTRSAGYLYFLFAQAGALMIFAAFGVVLSYSGSMAFASFASIPDEVKLIVFFLAFLGFGSKAGIVPIHIWLPHAHPAAPSHISAIMSGVMIKMGIYGILRMYTELAVTDVVVGQVVLVFGMVSGILGILYALGKSHLKGLLAYSSVENIGIILIGAGLGMIGAAKGNMVMAGFGFSGALLHMLNHSICKSLLFLGAGTVIKKSGTGNIEELGGLMKRLPVTGRAFLVGSVSISGLPPCNGFIGEFLIYLAAFQCLEFTYHINLFFAILAIVSLAVIGSLTTFCFTKFVGMVFLGEPRTAPAAKAQEGSWAMTLPMIVLAAACLAIGIFPESIMQLAFFGITDLGDFHQFDPQLLATIGSNLAMGSRTFLLLFLLVSLLRKLLYRGKEIAKGPTWGCGFTRPTTRIQYTGASFSRTVVGFFRPFVIVKETLVQLTDIFPARTTYECRVDDIAEVGWTRGVASPLLAVLGRLRWIQHGNVQLYIGYIILTILIVLLTLIV